MHDLVDKWKHYFMYTQWSFREGKYYFQRNLSKLNHRVIRFRVF